jgi:NAD(P)-dependent dehydrogenase (short-subunit alcohol dehydrogenase family)
LEVTSSESIETARKEVEVLTGGRLDILVNNAFVTSPSRSPRMIKEADGEIEDETAQCQP